MITLIIDPNSSADNFLLSFKEAFNFGSMAMYFRTIASFANRNGDYIIFLDSDDRLEKDIIESLVNILMNKDYDIILFTTVFEMNDKISTPCSLKSFEFNENDIDILNNSIYATVPSSRIISCFCLNSFAD